MDEPHERRRRDDGGAAAAQQSEAEHEPEAEPDFAEEHTNVTFADQLPGGPEGVTESEAPEGYAGMESRSASRRPGRDRD